MRYLRVGVIVRTHGIKGEVKVFPTTDSPHRFDALKKVKMISDESPDGIEPKSGTKPNGEFVIEGVKYFKNLVIVKFKGIDSIEEASGLKGAGLYIPREEGVKLKEGEYYIADIIDMDVIDETGMKIGVIRDVLETGANDVYIIKRQDNGKDLLIPAIQDCILDVDVDNNLMRVHIMDGLLDL